MKVATAADSVSSTPFYVVALVTRVGSLLASMIDCCVDIRDWSSLNLAAFAAFNASFMPFTAAVS